MHAPLPALGSFGAAGLAIRSSGPLAAALLAFQVLPWIQVVSFGHAHGVLGWGLHHTLATRASRPCVLPVLFWTVGSPALD